MSTFNDPLITELVEIMDCELILQAQFELGVYFDHISGLCSNFDLGLWPSEAFYRPYYFRHKQVSPIAIASVNEIFLKSAPLAI